MTVTANRAEYETDIIAWANEQAAMIRAGRFNELDIEHIADEVAGVGKSEQRELAHRMAVLLAHLLKWQYQPERRGARWESTIRTQRIAIETSLKNTPSLKSSISNPDWWVGVWADAVHDFSKTGLDIDMPDTCPWTVDLILKVGRRPSTATPTRA
jgi:hypothetical protein